MVFPVNFQRIFQPALFNYQRVNWAKFQQEAAAFRWQCLDNKAWKPWTREKAYLLVLSREWGNGMIHSYYGSLPDSLRSTSTKNHQRNRPKHPRNPSVHAKTIRNRWQESTQRDHSKIYQATQPSATASHAQRWGYCYFFAPNFGPKSVRSSISRCTCEPKQICARCDPAPSRESSLSWLNTS